MGLCHLRIEEYSSFITRHPRFLLYVEDGSSFDWLSGYLPEVASLVEVVQVERNRKLYLVTISESVGQH